MFYCVPNPREVWIEFQLRFCCMFLLHTGDDGVLHSQRRMTMSMYYITLLNYTPAELHGNANAFLSSTVSFQRNKTLEFVVFIALKIQNCFSNELGISFFRGRDTNYTHSTSWKMFYSYNYGNEKIRFYK